MADFTSIIEIEVQDDQLKEAVQNIQKLQDSITSINKGINFGLKLDDLKSAVKLSKDLKDNLTFKSPFQIKIDQKDLISAVKNLSELKKKIKIDIDNSSLKDSLSVAKQLRDTLKEIKNLRSATKGAGGNIKQTYNYDFSQNLSSSQSISFNSIMMAMQNSMNNAMNNNIMGGVNAGGGGGGQGGGGQNATAGQPPNNPPRGVGTVNTHSKKWKELEDLVSKDPLKKAVMSFVSTLKKGAKALKWTFDLLLKPFSLLFKGFSGLQRVLKPFLAGGAIAAGLSALGVMGLIRTSENIGASTFTTNALGVNPMDLKRITASYGQMMDVPSVLNKLAVEQRNPASLLMTRLGLSPQQAEKESLESLFDRLVNEIKNLSKMDQGHWQTVINAMGLGDVVDTLTVNRFSNVSPKYLADIEASKRKYQPMQLEQPEQWALFGMHRQLGMTNVETSILNLIRPILKPLENAFSGAFEIFEKGNQKFGIAEKVQQFADGLDNLITLMRKGEWEKIKETFLDAGTAAFTWFKAKADDAWKWLKTNAFVPLSEWFKKEFITEENTRRVDAFMKFIKETPEHLKPVMDFMTQLPEKFNNTLGAIKKIFDDVQAMLVQFSNSWVAKNVLNISPISSATANEAPPIPAAPNQIPEQAPELPMTDVVGKKEKYSKIPKNDKYDVFFAQYGHLFGVPPEFVKAIAATESSFNPNATSPAGAQGLMQIMPKTWQRMTKELGFGDTFSNPYDPEQSVIIGTYYLSKLLNEFGKDMNLASAGYNAGEHRVREYNGIPPFKETKEYVKKVSSAYDLYSKDYSKFETQSAMCVNGERPKGMLNPKFAITIFNKSTTADAAVQCSKLPTVPASPP